MGTSPTALNKRGNKVYMDGYTFDSQKECDFYAQFIRNRGLQFNIHPTYDLEPYHQLSEFNTHVIQYSPDVVVYSDTAHKHVLHVYDVKNSFTTYGIDASVKLRFTLFAARYGIPVEAVVIRKHDFKVIAMGITKQRSAKEPLICRDIFYDWRGAMKL